MCYLDGLFVLLTTNTMGGGNPFKTGGRFLESTNRIERPQKLRSHQICVAAILVLAGSTQNYSALLGREEMA